jgi:hypothetical protein
VTTAQGKGGASGKQEKEAAGVPYLNAMATGVTKGLVSGLRTSVIAIAKQANFKTSNCKASQRAWGNEGPGIRGELRTKGTRQVSDADVKPFVALVAVATGKGGALGKGIGQSSLPRCCGH